MIINIYPLSWGSGWVIDGVYKYKYYEKVFVSISYKNAVKKFYKFMKEEK